MEEKKEPCPEFPFFGARYPDARCIDGQLYDLDACDENGNLYEREGCPCPFCDFDGFIAWEVGEPEDHDNQHEYDCQVQQVKEWMQAIKEKYA